MDGDAPTEDPSPTEPPPNIEIKGGEARVRTEDGQEDKLLAGKYKTVEELEKGYAELQKAFSKGDKGDPAPPPATSDAGGEEDSLVINRAQEGEESAEALIAKALQEGEDLPLAKLKKMGVSESTADLIRQGIEAESSRFRSELYRVVDGKDNYGPISKWAADNADPEELEAYNRAVTTGDLPTSRLLLRGLRAAYEAAEGSTEPSRIRGSNTPRATGAQPYASQAEWISDINNPKYSEDPAFRREVMERVRVSTVI